MTTVEKIKSRVSSMTKSERTVALFFLEHSGDFAFYTLHEISEKTGLSTTSVLRFCRSLGFAGFKDFRNFVRNEGYYQPDLPVKFNRFSKREHSDSMLPDAFNQGIVCINETFKNISVESAKAAVSLIIEAKRVFTFGMKESYALAHYAYTRLFTVRNNVFLLNADTSGNIEQILSLTEGDVCVFFLFHRYSKASLELLPLLKERKVKIILITSAPTTSVENYAEVMLCCKIDLGGIKNTFAAPIVLTDYLLSATAVSSGETALSHMKEIEELFKKSNTLG